MGWVVLVHTMYVRWYEYVGDNLFSGRSKECNGTGTGLLTIEGSGSSLLPDVGRWGPFVGAVRGTILLLCTVHTDRYLYGLEYSVHSHNYSVITCSMLLTLLEIGDGWGASEKNR
jgi:hypothetical protein